MSGKTCYLAIQCWVLIILKPLASRVPLHVSHARALHYYACRGGRWSDWYCQSVCHNYCYYYYCCCCCLRTLAITSVITQSWLDGILRVWPFSSTPPIRQPHSVFGGFLLHGGAWMLLCWGAIIAEDNPQITMPQHNNLLYSLGVLASVHWIELSILARPGCWIKKRYDARWIFS